MTTEEQVLQTTEDIRKAFLCDLAGVLAKYSAEIEISGDENMEVYIEPKYDDEFNCVYQPLFINLNTWVNAEHILNQIKPY